MANFADDIVPGDELHRSGSSQVDESGVTSSGSLRTNAAGAALMAPAVVTPTNENTPLLLRSDSHFRVGIISGNYDADDREFGKIFSDAEQSIDLGIYPQRISQGSSGSYFIKNSDGVGTLLVSDLCTLRFFLCGVKTLAVTVAKVL